MDNYTIYHIETQKFSDIIELKEHDLSKVVIWQPKKTFMFNIYLLLWHLPFGNKWKDHWNTKMCNHINKPLLDVFKNNKFQKLVKPFKDSELEWKYTWEVNKKDNK